MLLVILSISLALLASESVIRMFSLDVNLMKNTLYYQCAYTPLHRISADPQRIYELTPESSLRSVKDLHPNETKYRELKLSVNSTGFRNRNFPLQKKDGVYRIVFFGGSNTFGAAVSDGDTYPEQLQKLFDKKYPGKVEVWNAGTCAYVMSQNIAYAEDVLQKYSPDMIVFQDTNVGRRAFLFGESTADIKRQLERNKELYPENLPLVRQTASSKLYEIHYALVSNSACYRVLCVAVYKMMGVFTQDPTNPISDNKSYFWYYYGQMVNERSLNQFTQRHPEIPVALFYIDDDTYASNNLRVTMRENMRIFVLDATGKPSEYFDIHPPSYVYEWYARELLNFLTSNFDFT
jgi:hypothetical protein